MTDLITILGGKDNASYRVAEAFTLLLRAPLDREAGHDYDSAPAIGIDGQARTIKIFPPRWIKRLELAFDGGAFERMEPSAIADRILTTDVPDDLETIAIK